MTAERTDTGWSHAIDYVRIVQPANTAIPERIRVWNLAPIAARIGIVETTLQTPAQPAGCTAERPARGLNRHSTKRAATPSICRTNFGRGMKPAIWMIDS